MDLTKPTEIQIVYRHRRKAADRPKINGSRDAEKILRPLFATYISYRESMYAIFLCRGNRVLGIFQIGLGGISGVAVDPKLIFQGALKANASGIILAHNHPSGSRAASQADIDLTMKVKQAGQFLEIAVLDHLILLPHDGYYSMADEGII